MTFFCSLVSLGHEDISSFVRLQPMQTFSLFSLQILLQGLGINFILNYV